MIWSQLRGKQPSFQSPSHSVASSVSCRLVTDSGEEGRRQTHPVESYAVEEIGGTTTQEMIPRKVHTVAVPKECTEPDTEQHGSVGTVSTVL